MPTTPQTPTMPTNNSLANFDPNDIPDAPPPSEIAQNELLPGTLTSVSYTLPPRLTFKRWLEIVGLLDNIGKGIPWWLGDALNEGERRWGEKYSQAIRATGYAAGTLKNYASVAARYPKEKRREDIPWSHYYAAMTLAGRSPARAARLVEHAHDEGWDRSQVRAAAAHVVRQIDDDHPDTVAPEPTLDPPRLTYGAHRPGCPTCSCPILDEQ